MSSEPELGRAVELRRDPATLGFSVGFLCLGGAGLLHAAGLAVTSQPLYPLLLVGLGAAGLWRVRNGWLRSRQG